MTSPPSTIVYQSVGPGARPVWLDRCLASARAWAAARGHSYRLLGDELFEALPDGFLDRCTTSILPATDLGRLLWARRLLAEGFQRVIWIDADVLVFDPDAFDMPSEPGAYFTHEVWVEGEEILHFANNCVLCMDVGSVLLPFCIDACLRIAGQYPETIPKLDLGTEFLTPLHRLVPLPRLGSVGLLEGRLMADVLRGGGPRLSHYVAAVEGRLGAANLCGSFGRLPPDDARHIATATFEAVVDRLLAQGALVA